MILFKILVVLLLVCVCSSEIRTVTQYQSINSKELIIQKDAVRSKSNLTYTCIKSDPILIHVNYFDPAQVTLFKIQNCENVTISFSCNGNRRHVESLHIRNVTFLRFNPVILGYSPPNVLIEDVKDIESIPERTFVEIDPKHEVNTCRLPTNHHIKNIVFRNCSIGSIETNAFTKLKELDIFHFDLVRMGHLHNKAINVQFKKSLKIENSTFGVVEHLAFQICGKEATFSNNVFETITTSGMNGTIETFNFSENAVGTLQPFAFSILSQNVYIIKNKFNVTNTNAFQGISPGLLKDFNNSDQKFSKLTFIYNFLSNNFSEIDILGLHPDVESYINVHTDFQADHNQFNCTCKNIWWMFDANMLKHYQHLNEFYMSFIPHNLCDPQNKDYCNKRPITSTTESIELKLEPEPVDEYYGTKQYLKITSGSPHLFVNHFALSSVILVCLLLCLSTLKSI